MDRNDSLDAVEMFIYTRMTDHRYNYESHEIRQNNVQRRQIELMCEEPQGRCLGERSVLAYRNTHVS